MKKQKIIGWIGPTDDNYVSGWILDKNNADVPLKVIIEINGIEMPPVIASAPRDHLRERNIKNVRHGFKCFVPDEILERSPGPIRMWPTSLPTEVITSREAFKPPKKSTDPRLLTIIGDALEERKKPRGLDWNKMAALGSELVGNKDLQGILLSAGRGCIYNKQFDKGLRLLETCTFLFPDLREAQYYKGVLLSNSGEALRSLDVFRDLHTSGWKPKQVCLEYSKALVRAIDKSGHKADESLKAEFIEITRELAALDDGKINYTPSIPLRLAHSGDVELALVIADRLIARKPDQPHGMVNKSRILIEEGRYDEGLELSRDILRIWPDNEVAQYHLRVYSEFSTADGAGGEPKFAILNGDEVQPTDGASPMSLVAALDLNVQLDWIYIGSDTDPDTWPKLVKQHRRAGCIDLPTSGTLWRVEVLRSLAESDLINPKAPLPAQLEPWHPFYIPIAFAPARRTGKVLLMSRYGTSKFGGAEHTMASLSAYYREAGLGTVLAGTDESVTPNETLGPNIWGDRVPSDATGLRAYILENGFAVVHAISGMGFPIAQALAYSNITMVYGIYFWRDVLGREGLETYFDNTDAPIPRAEFKYILRQAHTVFVNSKYTRNIIEEAHQVRLPIVYSIPEEIGK